MWADHGVEFFVHPAMQTRPAVRFPEFFRHDREGWELRDARHSREATTRPDPPICEGLQGSQCDPACLESAV